LELASSLVTSHRPKSLHDVITHATHELELAPLDQFPQVQAPQPQPPLDAV
jgi:hypothetical protein